MGENREVSRSFEGIHGNALGKAFEAEGLERYEVSSWARPGRAAVHNRRYWQRRPVLGLGVGAHSHEPARVDEPYGARSANERALPAYLARIEARSCEPPEREVLSEATARSEIRCVCIGCVARTLALKRRKTR